jgi:putative hydrolase of the HAD superfamily
VSWAGTVACFDLDDTLVSERDYVESGLRAAGDGLDREAPGEVAAGAWLVDLWRREAARDGFQRLLRARGLDEATWLPRLREWYRAHAPALEPRAGAAELVATLAGRGARLALVSDGHADVQRKKWASLRLPARFDPVIFTDERGREYWKPHPWAFEQVMAAHPGARRFLYVADNPAKDFIAPNRLGWTTVLVRDPRNVHPARWSAPAAAPQVVVDAIAEVADVDVGEAPPRRAG